MAEPSRARPPEWWAGSDDDSEPDRDKPNGLAALDRPMEPDGDEPDGDDPNSEDANGEEPDVDSPDGRGADRDERDHPGEPDAAGPRPPEVDHAPEADQPEADRPAVPSWGTVLATTIRLWLERRGLRKPASPAPAAKPGWRKLGIVGLVLVLFAAGVLTIAVIRHTSAAAPSGPAAAPGGGSLRSATAARDDAASWIVQQVSRGAIVACDPVMCAVLQARGFPAGNLLILGSSAADPLGSAVVVATAAVRSQLGSRLTSEYATTVLASFGSGTARVDVMVTATEGAAAYQRAFAADLQARRVTGAQLLRNAHIKCAAPAHHELASGRVDPRLLITLAALAAHDQVRIVAFGGGAPGTSPGVPLRTADLAAPPGVKGSSYLLSVRAFLRAQRAPYLASTISITRPARGRPVLHVGFAAPSPLGLLGSGTPAASKQS